MNLEKFTTSSQELINSAVAIATEHKNPTLLPLHLLATSLNNEFCISFYKVLNTNIETLKNLCDQEIKKLPQAEGGQLYADRTLEDFFNQCHKRG